MKSYQKKIAAASLAFGMAALSSQAARGQTAAAVGQNVGNDIGNGLAAAGRSAGTIFDDLTQQLTGAPAQIVVPAPVSRKRDPSLRMNDCLQESDNYILSQKDPGPTAREFYSDPAAHADIDAARATNLYQDDEQLVGAIESVIGMVSGRIEARENALCTQFAQRIPVPAIVTPSMQNDISFRLQLDRQALRIVHALASEGRRLVDAGKAQPLPDNTPPLLPELNAAPAPVPAP